MYRAEKEVPKFFWDVLIKQRTELTELQKKFRKDKITPAELS